jgi:hypothetical protein
VPPTADPFVVVDPDVVPDADLDEGDDTGGNANVGTLSGSAVTPPTGAPV